MTKYEYKVQKVHAFNVEAATETLNELGNQGFKIEFATAKDAHIVVLMSRERPGPGRPKKEKESEAPSEE